MIKKLVCMVTVLLLPSVLFPAAASAFNDFDIVITSDRPPVLDVPNGFPSVNNLLGDTVGVAVTAFGEKSGGFITGPGVHTVGTTSVLASAMPGVVADHEVFSLVSDDGNMRTLSIRIANPDFNSVAPAGTLVGMGEVATTMFFELPDVNGGADLLNDPDKIGVATGAFILLDTTGVPFDVAPAGVEDFGTSFSLGNGIAADGADVFSVGISGAIWTVEYEIKVAETLVAPTSFQVFRGLTVEAELSDFELSDDVRASFNPGFTISNVEAPVWLVFDANAPNATSFIVESNAGTPGLTYTLEAVNWNTSSFDVIDTLSESFGTDVVSTFELNPADYVDTGGEVQTRVGWRRTGFTINFPWEVRVDQVGWLE